MWLAFIRKLFLTFIAFVILAFISYNILLRDPMNNLPLSAFGHYLMQLLQGDLGIPYTTGEPLAWQIFSVFPATISLCLAASVISLLLGIPLGFLAAVERESLLGKLLISLSSLSLAIPVFWLAIILLAYASQNQWQIAAVGELHPIYAVKQITGVQLVDIFLSDSPYKLKMMQSALQHLALPTLILAIPAILEMMRITQQRASYVLKQNYVKIARTRGWSPMKIWRVHVLRNTLPSLIPMIAHNITLIFAFGMLIENVVSWGGIGRWMINALSEQDYSAISAGVMVIGLFVIALDLLSSLLTTLLDPHQKKDWYVK
ncbi:peptide ABC transporter permease [Pasteurellaceae bacterium Macca]|nr:peptide ABC transporter permease [Pasteurellaceae bacterium Macca]